MSPRASTRVLAPKVEVPAPRANPGRRQRAGSWVVVTPARCTTWRKNPFQDVMAQRGMCSKGWAPHPMVHIGRAEGRPTVALHGDRVGEQHADAEAVAKASADFFALEVQSPGDGGRVEPCRDRAASAAAQVGAGAPPFCRAGCEGLLQGVSASLLPAGRNRLCAAARALRLYELTSWYSGSHRVPALLCRDAHFGVSCSLLGPSNGRTASGPLCMAWWVVAAATMYSLLTLRWSSTFWFPRSTSRNWMGQTNTTRSKPTKKGFVIPVPSFNRSQDKGTKVSG
jgi:hypothetical protein